MDTRLSQSQIDSIETSLSGLVYRGEAIHNPMRKVVEVPAATPGYQQVVFAILHASEAIKQLQAPAKTDPKVDAAYKRLQQFFVGKETTIQIYCPKQPGEQYTDMAQRIATNLWEHDLVKVSRAAVQRYFANQPIGHLECGHPESCIGNVDENETPRCLWCEDIKDMHTLVEHLGKVYSHMTKPEGFAVAESKIPDPHPPINIVVNGRGFPVSDTSHVHYEGIIALSGQNFIGLNLGKKLFKIPTLMTITYCNGHPDKPRGIVGMGESVKIVDGMIFDVADTSCA